jgi:hypothetical protein
LDTTLTLLVDWPIQLAGGGGGGTTYDDGGGGGVDVDVDVVKAPSPNFG